jgi:hypothetical protein
MTWTVDQSGTTSALTVGTETQLGSNSTTNATYVLKVNTSNMALGDKLTIKVYSEDISGGSVVVAWAMTFANVQAIPLKLSPPTPSDISLKCTLDQTSGTGRTYPWEILRI